MTADLLRDLTALSAQMKLSEEFEVAQQYKALDEGNTALAVTWGHRVEAHIRWRNQLELILRRYQPVEERQKDGENQVPRHIRERP